MPGDTLDGVCIVGRKYRVNTIFVTTETKNLNVLVPANCNSWLASNIGTNMAQVNQHELRPPPGPTDSGESWGPIGNPGDTYDGEITIRFGTATGGRVMIDFYIYT